MWGDSSGHGGRHFGSASILRAGLALATVLVLTSAGTVRADGPEGVGAEVAPPPRLWSANMYQTSVVRNQNPDWQACTAAATESMLNLIVMTSNADTPPPRGSSLPSSSMNWQIDTSYDMEESILNYERDNMTMLWSSAGTDPHGWRNALNYYGWGTMAAGVYVDAAYSSFDAAARQVVHSVARTGKPAGILAWFGGHAQYVTGYVVQGEDPRVSDDYTILGVYLSDPLEGDDMQNAYIPYSAWESGSLYYRFSPYYHDDSPYRDPIDGQIGYYEWWGKWVIIDAVR